MIYNWLAAVYLSSLKRNLNAAIRLYLISISIEKFNVRREYIYRCQILSAQLFISSLLHQLKLAVITNRCRLDITSLWYHTRICCQCYINILSTIYGSWKLNLSLQDLKFF